MKKRQVKKNLKKLKKNTITTQKLADVMIAAQATFPDLHELANAAKKVGQIMAKLIRGKHEN